MSRELSYATLDADGQVPLDQLDNAAGGGPHTHDASDIDAGTIDDARIPAGMARDAEVATEIGTHSADTTAVHGIADTSALSLTSHDHDADYEAAGGIATHSADSTAVHGIVDTSALSLTSHDHDADYEATGAVATHAGLADPHTGYRLESADHSHATTGLQGGTVAHTALTSVGANDHHAQGHSHPAEGAVVVTHASTTGQGVDDHHAQLHTASHLPTGTDPINKFSQSTIGTADQAIANTETVVLAKVMAANELAAGQMYRFEAWFTKAGTNASAAIIRIRIGTTTLTGNIAATLTPPNNALAVPGKIEGLLWIVSAGAGGTARGSLQQFVHLAAVTITSAINPATGTVAVDTTAANQRVELTFISGNAANTYTFRNAVMYRVA